MTTIYGCADCGCREFERGRCWNCGGNFSVEQQCGAPPPVAGMPNIVPDSLRPHFDYAAGCRIDSKSQRRRIYAAKGLALNTPKDWESKFNMPLDKPGPTVNYRGQKLRRSSAERRIRQYI